MVCLKDSKIEPTTMLNLFGMPASATTGVVGVPLWDYVRDGLRDNLTIATSYYRRYPVRVDSAHLLAQLLYSIGILKNQPIDQLYSYLSTRALKAATACRLTSSINKGELHNGVFYGPGTREVIIAHDDEFDPWEAQRNWRDLRPVQVLYHSHSDLGLFPPNGERTSNDDGMAVISINVPMLAIQYREFFNHESQIAAASGENPRSIMFFLGAYPLTNMLYSHLDTAVFNRLYCRRFNIPLGDSVKKQPMYLTDFGDKLDQVQIQQLEQLAKRSQKFSDALSMIPMVTAHSLFDLTDLPDMAPTRQVIWALILSRMRLLSFAANATSQVARTQSGSEINHLLRLFTLYNPDKVFQAVLPPEVYYDVKRDMEEIFADMA